MAAAYETISPEALAEQRQHKPVHIIDVRSPQEFVRLHIAGATNIPLAQLTPATLPKDSEPIYVICRRGTRAESACAQLVTQGMASRVVHVSGGVEAWRDAGLPVVRQKRKRRFTPERIILTGATCSSLLLAILVHRGFAGIVGYVVAYVVAVGIARYDFRPFFNPYAPDDTFDD